MYKLQRNGAGIIRQLEGGAMLCIPPDESNSDFKDFIRWRDGWTETLEDGPEVVHPPNTPEPADPEPPPTQEELDRDAARAYAKLVALKNMTPAQVRAWCAANITNLAEAKDALTTLAVAVGILARRL